METVSSPDTVPERVRDQYNRAPYPQVSWFATCPRASIAHATFEAGAALTYRKRESHEGKRIALLGSGTFEPYSFGRWQPKAKIDAVDLSTETLKIARVRCFLHAVRNVGFHENDLNLFCAQNKNVYDYIQCYGVLHHLENPEEGFKSLRFALKDDGFARIMVYSKTSRRRPRLIRKAASLLFGEQKQDAATLKKLITALPWNHPLKLSFLTNSDNQTDHGIVDSSLHTCEHAFSLDELLKILNQSDLELCAWDFSQNILNLLGDTAPKNILGKIHELEAFDQWPTSFTFWVRPNRAATPFSSGQKIHAPFAPPWPWEKAVYSTVLRRSVHLSKEHRELWRRCKDSPPEKGTIKAASLNELLAARFLLEVDHDI